MATAQPVFYRDEANNDSDVETIDPGQDLVTFDDVPRAYNPGEDIFVVYHLGRDCRPSSRDWVGLYPLGWTSTKDYITFEWSPKAARDLNHPHLRSVLFKAKNITVAPSHVDLYQFLYMTKHSEVIGVSRKFHIYNVDPRDALVCVDRPLQGVSSLTFVESEIRRESSNNSFELVEAASSTSSDLDSEYCDIRKLFKLKDDSVTSEPNLRLLYDANNNRPVQERDSSDFHLDLLFEAADPPSLAAGTDDKDTKDEEEKEEAQVYEDILFQSPPQCPLPEVLIRLSDICDTVWQDLWEELMDDTCDAVSAERSTQESDPCALLGPCSKGAPTVSALAADMAKAVVVYKPLQVLPYHPTAVVPYQGAGPVVSYKQQMSCILPMKTNRGPSAQNREDDKDDASEEALLTAICTRYFKQANQNHDNKQLLDLSHQREQFMTHLLSKIPILHLDALTGLAVPNTQSTAPKPKKMRRKDVAGCKRCAQKMASLLRQRRLKRNALRLTKQLKKTLKQSNEDMHIKEIAMEDLGQQVKDLARDSFQLEAVNGNLRTKLTTKEKEIEQQIKDRLWLEQTLAASQEEGKQLKVSYNAIRKELAEVREKYEEKLLEAKRQLDAHVATIASKDLSLLGLTEELHTLKEQLQQVLRDKEQMSSCFGEASRNMTALLERIGELREEIQEIRRDEKLLSSDRQSLSSKNKRLAEEVEKLQKELLHLRQSKTGSTDPDTSHKQTASSSCQTKTARTQCQASQTNKARVRAASCQAPQHPSPEPSAPETVAPGAVGNCDPAILAVGFNTLPANGSTTYCVAPTQPTTKQPSPATAPDQASDAKKTFSPASFFASGMEFLSSFHFGEAEAAVPEKADVSLVARPKIAASTAVDGAAQGARRKSWDEIVEEEERVSEKWAAEVSEPAPSGKSSQSRVSKYQNFKSWADLVDECTAHGSEDATFKGSDESLSSCEAGRESRLKESDSSSGTAGGSRSQLEDGVTPRKRSKEDTTAARAETCWQHWVEDESQRCPWTPDFSVAWKPKSGKKRSNQSPGRVVRFEPEPSTSGRAGRGTRTGKGRYSAGAPHRSSCRRFGKQY